MAMLRLLLSFADSIGARLDASGVGFRVGQNVRVPDLSLTLKERRRIFGPHRQRRSTGLLRRS